MINIFCIYRSISLSVCIHSVLQFVPTHVDIRVCNFRNATVQVSLPRVPVDIMFAVRDGRGYLTGSEVSEHLRKLSLVEFSFYVGFPALISKLFLIQQGLDSETFMTHLLCPLSGSAHQTATR
uniref:UPF0606 protein KIAA1549-like n=1 Tax=Neolamprologus brichardi TaxID=32507 RepID=A0A3Q4I250_NEOBR